jgi:hypothetical protein
MKHTYIGSGLIILVLLGCFVFVCGCDGEPYTEIQWKGYGTYTTSTQPYVYGTLIFHEDNTYDFILYPSGLNTATGATSGTSIPIHGGWEPASGNHMIVNLPDLPYGYNWHFSDPHHAEFAYDSYYPRIVMYPQTNREEYLYQDVETYKKYNGPSSPDYTVTFPIIHEITPEPYH